MASTTEESHEVKAIKQHIATIKSQISLTTNNVSSAKSNMDAAIAMYAALQSQLDVSKKELKDVEKLLVEAEQRAAVNNDVDDNVKQEGGGNKRRKVSPPPQEEGTNNNSAGVTVKKEEDDHAYDEETDKEDGDIEDGKEEDDDGSSKPPATNIASANNNNSTGSQSNDDMNTTTASTTNNQVALGSSTASTSTAARQSTSINNVNKVIIEGCGDSDINGTFTKVVGKMYNGAPVYINKVYAIYRNSISMGPNNWYISHWNGHISYIDGVWLYYGSPNNTDSMTPPTNGWVTLRDGYNPAPKLRLVTAANSDANSKGAQKVSGSIGSSSTAGPSSADQSSRDAVQVMTQSKDGSRARSIPNHIVVSECGNVELNGRYQRESEGSGMFREYNHAPVYTKKGEWKGKNVTFAIFREVYSSKPILWYIGRSNTRTQSNFEDEKRTLFKCYLTGDIGTDVGQTNLLLPPKKDWVIIGTTRGGVNPAPTLSY